MPVFRFNTHIDGIEEYFIQPSRSLKTTAPAMDWYLHPWSSA
jgi:hypothetical protein